MLSFFRGKHGSKFVFIFFGLVLLAMVSTGVGTGGGLGNIGSLLSANTDLVAKVNGDAIEKAEVGQIAQNLLERQREQQPNMTMQNFVGEGAIDKIVSQILSDRALVSFGESHGMKISKRAVDAQIAQIQAFNGLDGKFDHTKMIDLLSRQHLTEQQFRDDYARTEMTKDISVPIAGAAQMPKGVVAAYASLLLEVREGHIAAIPAALMTKTPMPSEADISAYYARHRTQYTVPEQRVIEYAVYDKAKFADAAKPSEAEIAAAYAKDKDKYAAKDLRTITQVVVGDEAKAKALSEKVRGGSSLADAAKGLGLEAVTLAEQDKSAYAGLTSATVADAAFKAERGTYTSPAKGPLGWYVVHVDRVSHDEGKTLDQAREGIIKTLSAGKIEEVFANFQNKVADKASAGARFDELVKANGGEVVTTPLIVGSGADPKNPAYKPAPEAAAVLHDAFKSDTKTSSEPLIVPYGKTRDMVALYHVKAITPSGPVPLATIHDQVAHDAQIEAAAKAARVIAGDVLAKANKGSSLAEAMKATGMQLPPVDTMAANKVQLMQQQQKNKQPIPPPVREMFNIPLHHGKIVEFARHDGWYVIWLDNKKSMDASTQPGFIEQVQQEYGKAYGPELVAQFSNAVQTKVGAVKYPANIKALSAALTGNQGQ